MNLENYIKALISEGKSNQEIATEVSEYYPQAGVDEILKAIKAAKQIEAKASQVGLAVLKDELSEALKAELKASIDESLEKIQVNLNTYKSVPTQNVFDFKKGEYREVKAEKKEAYQKMGELLTAYTRGDMPSMHSISKEIEQENAKALNIKSPAVSDINAQGGYAIPTLVREDIFQLQYASTPLMSLMRVEEITVNTVNFPILGAITVTPIADQSTAVPEKTPTFASSSLTVYRFGGFTNIANTFLDQKANLTNAFVTAYASASSRAMELYVLCGVGGADLVTGIVFDANTTRPTAYALSTLDVDKLEALTRALSDEATSRRAFIANKKVRNKVGMLTHGNNSAFPMFIGNGELAPFGTPFIECPKIPSTLDVGGSSRTAGTDDVLILADFDKIVLGIGTDLRFDISKDARFTDDQTSMRAIQRFGVKVIAPSACVAQELTN